MRYRSLGLLLAIVSCPSYRADAEQSVAATNGSIDVRIATCAGDFQTPTVRAIDQRRESGPGSPEFVRTGAGRFSVPPGYYKVIVATNRCFGEAYVGVLPGRKRDITPVLANDPHLDRSVGFAGTFEVSGATLSLTDADDPSVSHDVYQSGSAFYADLLTPGRYVLAVHAPGGDTARFGIDLSGAVPGDLATIDVGNDAFARQVPYAGPLFAGADDIAISGGRLWYVDSGRGVVGSITRAGDERDVRVDALHVHSEIRGDDRGGVWAYDLRAQDVAHVDAAGVVRTVHLPAHDAAASAFAATAVSQDGGLLVLRDRLQTVYQLGLDGSIAPVQLRPGFSARNYGVDASGAIYFTEGDANAPLARYRNGALEYVPADRTGEPQIGLEIIGDAFEQGRFDGGPDAVFRFGLRGTHATAATSGAVRDGGHGFWSSDCNTRAVTHEKSDRTSRAYRLPPGFCPTELASGPSGLWILDRARPSSLVHVGNDGKTAVLVLPTKGAGVRDGSLRLAPDGTLWFLERDRNRIGYASDAGVVELPAFGLGAMPQAVILR